MARVKRAVNAQKKRREVLEQASGYRGQRSRLYRKAKEQVSHSLTYAYRDRKDRKGTFRRLKEFHGGENLEVGAEVKIADLFREGDKVHVTGMTKGRGFAGVIKRHGFGGFRATHGTHEFFRHGGSIGNRSFPGRVFKGKRMAGRLGNDRVTTRNLTVAQIRAEQNLLLIVGAVAGSRGGYVEVRPASEEARA